jgi:hypothetical protein
MKRLLSILVLVFFAFNLSGQDAQELVSQCALDLGENTTYLKDFVIKLPTASNPDDAPVHKANFYFMKNQNYRFTMCNGEASDGELVLNLYDKQKLITSSVLKSSGKVYSSVDFTCNKTGLYQLWYAFKDGQKGYGVGIVSLVK